MAAERLRPTLADYMAIAISPVFVMALVGSLIFFLLEILYAGEHVGRLKWILFFYVFGAVLVARLGLQQEAGDRASLYGVILGLLTWLALQLYVEYPADLTAGRLSWLINVGLIALSWWCTNRLTRDCTHLDEDEEAGAGLLESAGVDPSSAEPGAVEATAAKRRAPGVWVVYFSLAALPIFGLGQSLIPVEEVARRRYAFWLTAIYVGSGLGLLLTTCFLGLRRYLRQRKVEMPATVAGVWLTTGGILAGALLLVGALLPRPHAEYALIDLGALAGSPERDASRFAGKTDGAGKGDGRASSDRNQQGKQGEARGDGPKGAADRDGQGKQGDGGGKDGRADGKSANGKQGSQGQKGDGKTGGTSENQGKGEDRNGDRRSPKGDAKGEREKGDASRGEDRRREGAKGETREGKKQGDRAESKAAGQEPGGAPQPPPTPSPPLAFLEVLREVAKWLLYALLGVLALYVCGRAVWAVLKQLANFSQLVQGLLNALRGLWRSLFGWWPWAAAGGSEEVEEAQRPQRPFSWYRDPFESGAAERWAPAEVVRYSFEALEAWAREAHVGRQPGETPLEFVSRLGDEAPAVEAEARRIAGLYVQTAYGRGKPTRTALEPLRQFWRHLAAVAEQPLSAGMSGS